jgi:ubiquinone/menaquinone biosynthesis C-methylase UbiE
MRSMLDHVQIVDLCLLEARRVLKPGGQLLVGISIEGRPFGQLGIDLRPKVLIKNSLKSILARIGFDRYRDEHVWHPTFENLRKVIIDAGFTIEDIYWQPAWQGKVVYIGARVKTALEVC